MLSGLTISESAWVFLALKRDPTHGLVRLVNWTLLKRKSYFSRHLHSEKFEIQFLANHSLNLPLKNLKSSMTKDIQHPLGIMKYSIFR